MTNDNPTHVENARPSDEELFEFVEGTLPAARRAEIAQAIERDPDLHELVGSAQLGAEATHSYASARMPMDSAVSLHRALGAEWLEREERERTGDVAKQTAKVRPTTSRSSKPAAPKQSAHRGSWWRSPSVRVALSFAVVALVAGVGISGLRSVSSTNESSAPSLQDSSPGPAERSAESPSAGASAVADSANEKNVAPPAGSDATTAPATDPAPVTAPAPSTPESGEEPQSQVVCVFVDASVPIPVSGPANPVLGDVKNSISLDFTIAPYRIDCKF